MTIEEIKQDHRLLFNFHTKYKDIKEEPEFESLMQEYSKLYTMLSELGKKMSLSILSEIESNFLNK